MTTRRFYSDTRALFPQLHLNPLQRVACYRAPPLWPTMGTPDLFCNFFAELLVNQV
jgi:hypothetical protein